MAFQSYTSHGVDQHLPRVLQDMVQDLSRRPAMKRIESDLDDAMQLDLLTCGIRGSRELRPGCLELKPLHAILCDHAAGSQYSFLREQALRKVSVTLCDTAVRHLAPAQLERILDARHCDLMDAALSSLGRFLQEQSRGAGEEPAASVASLAADEETMALRALQGLFLMHNGSRALAVQRGVVNALVQSLPRPSEGDSMLVLDILLSLQINDQSAQEQLTAADGLKRVCMVLCSPETGPRVGAKCCEFLALLIHHVFPKPPPKAALRQLEEAAGKAVAAKVLEAQADLAGEEAYWDQLYKELKPLAKAPQNKRITQ